MSGAQHGETFSESILIGMSGGVDSSVAAMLLKEQGYRVVGVTLRLWTDPMWRDERKCCSPEAVHRAKAVAHSLGIPHLIVDAKDAFYSGVVEYFVDEYARGRTPNPCVKCNSRVRFGFMLDLARRLGLDRIATGHYARLLGEPAGLARGSDTRKDQSYVLAEVPPDLLHQTVFPLGEMTKAEVRSHARRAGLTGHGIPESQEICFVPDNDYRRFLRERLGERPGTLVDQQGKMLGHHPGTYNFTIGQRKRLGVAADKPRYVVAVAADRCEVVVGDCSDIAVGVLVIEEPVCHRAGVSEYLTVQARSTGGVVPAHMVDSETIVLEQPIVGVAPGQTAVLYEGDLVMMAGTIRSAEPWTGSSRHRADGGK
jgi:tRNA-uridine 2-sulfurtransferase